MCFPADWSRLSESEGMSVSVGTAPRGLTCCFFWLGFGFEVGHFVLLGTAVSKNYFSAPNWMVHKVAKSPRAKLRMQVKSDLKLNPLLGHHVTLFIGMSCG